MKKNTRVSRGQLKFVFDFLVEREIYDLNFVDRLVKEDYRKYILKKNILTDSKKNIYLGLLDRIWLTHIKSYFPVITKQVMSLSASNSIKNKLLTFLCEVGIQEASEITYEIRELAKKQIISTKRAECIANLDRLKLQSIEEENQKNPLGLRKYNVGHQHIFLLYHPNIEIARSFRYMRNKEELHFDMTILDVEILQKQIIEILNWVLDSVKNFHDRRERFLLPLKWLYIFCVKNGIVDILQMNDIQEKEFKKMLEFKNRKKANLYDQILYNSKKFLFLNSPTINWNSKIWFLERFSIEAERKNPAREIKTFSFGAIHNDDNCLLFQKYMKYQMALSKRALQSVRMVYYDLKDFFQWMDKQKIRLQDLKSEELSQYLMYLYEKNNQPESYNRALRHIDSLFQYLVVKGIIERVPLYFDYYSQKSFLRHNDRTVPKKIQQQILKAIGRAPEEKRLMFLNLWMLGLRVSEVCQIKGGAYHWDGKDAWITVYQNKMKAEKNIPIPSMLYDLMKSYISKQQILPDEYVFQNKNGGAYCAETFTKFMKKFLKVEKIEYDFRAHDFRHSVAFSFYQNNTSLESIRDYLGHKDSDMTKQYIDFYGEILDKKNMAFFEEKKNKLIDLKKEKRGKNIR